MERLGLLLLMTSAAIGVGLNPLETGLETDLDAGGVPTDAVVASRTIAAEALALAPSPVDETSGVEATILERFSLRHTALPERERRRLARVIVEQSRVHDLDPDLVMAVIEVESAGYPLAVSRVGALGLMQLLPSTARELADKHGIPWKGPDTLFDAEINVRLGTAYLRELADRYDDDVDTALAAYNWGPGRIDRRIRRGARVPSLYTEQVRRAVDRYAALSSMPSAQRH